MNTLSLAKPITQQLEVNVGKLGQELKTIAKCHWDAGKTFVPMYDNVLEGLTQTLTKNDPTVLSVYDIHGLHVPRNGETFFQPLVQWVPSAGHVKNPHIIVNPLIGGAVRKNHFDFGSNGWFTNPKVAQAIEEATPEFGKIYGHIQDPQTLSPAAYQQLTDLLREAAEQSQVDVLLDRGSGNGYLHESFKYLTDNSIPYRADESRNPLINAFEIKRTS